MPRAAHEVRVRHIYPSFALHLEESPPFPGGSPLKCRKVVERQVAESRQQRIEAFLDFRLSGGRHRSQCAPVERLGKGKHLIARLTARLAVGMAGTAGGFDQAVVCPSAPEFEKNLAGKLHQILHDYAPNSACWGIW